ncbi:MAG TPA: DNA polymerase III subunit gamma/tau [Chthoniobacterales bacterium]|nr:DNA polymerase III subunit gamma/tau [Chthoniobacterales bacterium]
MSYEVFARKYRPQTFDDLVGQTHVSRTLKNAVGQNRLAHAYLFVGPRGTGKTSTARILAKALNCLSSDKPTITPCNKCTNCLEIAAGNSMDVLEIDGASNNKVDEVRILTENVRYAPANARFKIYVIDEVHMLTAGAFNALLKTLEEPPPHVKFIFATTEPQKVLPTIVSRCQRFDLHRISANLIASHLQLIAGKEKIKLESAAAHAIARGAEGGLRDAESMLDQLVAFCGQNITEADVLSIFGFTSQQTVSEFTERILRGANADAIQLLHEQSAAGKDMMRLMSDLISYLRDLLVFKVKPDALDEDVDSETRDSFVSQSGLVETARLLELIDQFADAENRMKWAPNKKLHFEVAIIKAIQSLGQATLDEVIEKLGELRGGKTVAPAKASGVGTASAARAIPSASKKANADPDLPTVASCVAESADSNVDPQKMWQQAYDKIPVQKAFVRNSAAAAHVLGTDGRNFLLGFAPDQKSTMDILGTAGNRKLIETLLHEVSGKDWSLKLSVQEKLAAKEKASDSLGADDPLIQEALEMFKGKIRS